MQSAVKSVLAGMVKAPALSSPPSVIAPSGITQILMYGQSLSLGSDPDGASVISSANAAHKMFTTGVRVHYDTAGIAIGNPNAPVNPDSMASMVTLAEAVNATIYGETFASGLASRLSGAALFSTTGRGAYTAAKLARDGAGVQTDTNHYQNTYAAALHGKLLIDTAGEAYTLGPVLFKQGEADGNSSITKAAWKTTVQGIRDDLARDLTYATLTDTSGLTMLVDQQAYQQATQTYGEIAVAAIELHRDGSGVVCVGPTYAEEFTATNDVHMTSNGYRNYGERLGRVYETIIGGGTWNPCHITGASRSGTTITLTVHVPAPPLVKDSGIITAIADDGFTYSGANITAVTITDTGVGDNVGQIQITIDADAGGTLGYAYENGTNLSIGPAVGPRGTIRDSESATTTNDSTPLYNWLCVDQWVLA